MSATQKRAASSTVAALAALALGVTGAATPARADSSTAPGAPAKSDPVTGTELRKVSPSGGARTALATDWYTFQTSPSEADEGWTLAVSGGRTDPGAPVIGWTHSTGSASQAWTYYQVAGSSNYVLRSATTSSWYALAISGGSKANGAPAIQWNFEVTGPAVHKEQQWELYFYTTGTQNFLLKNINSNKCLTGGAKGSGFTQQACDPGNRRQQFTHGVWY